MPTSDPSPERDFPAASYEETPDGYYDRVFRRGRGVQWFWHRERFRRVDASLPGAGRLLDVGCGPGTFLGQFAARFARRVGLDLAVGQIDYARRTYVGPGLEFRAADVREARLEGGFDAAVSIEVIEHLPRASAARMLEALRDSLAEGGILVLTTPNRRSHWPLLERLVSWRGPVDYRLQHINLYDRRRLRREVEDAGLEVLETRTFFVVAPFVAALSTGLAEAILRWERRFLPAAGCELLLVARRPKVGKRG
jgi:SAM-dependent methyltransferase